MRFALLGSLSVANDDGAIECTGSKPRTILGLLLLNANSVVSRDRIVEALWGEHVPATVHSSLYNHVTRLRRQLGAEGHERIKAVPPGYLIRVGPGELDVQVFGELRENGKRAAAAGAWRQAFDELTSALALWHDAPTVGLPELTGLEPADAQISRLQEERLHACEGRIEAGLRLGLHRELIADITALVRENPLTEVFHQQLMRALFGSGRQAEALAAFRELRELLATELGVEPSAASRDLHQLLLAGGPDPTPPAGRSADPAAGPAAPLVPTPRSLPAGIGDFTGRAEQVDWLLSLLTEPGEPRALVVSSIGGMGGIGKTTLAVHVGHLAGSQFPDGQLFVNLRGTSAEPLDPHDVLGGFLRQLGLAPEAVPDNTEERGALYRSLLADRRMLIVLDDAAGSDQVRPLIPGGSGSMVLVTVRQWLSDLDGAAHLHLDTLAEDAAVELFARIVGAERVRAESAATREVLGICAGLPLAIRLAGGRLAARPNWRVGDLAGRLRSAANRLDEFDLGRRSLRSVFEVGYTAFLDDRRGPGPAARAFCLLGLCTGQDLGLPAAATLLGLPEEQAGRLLEQLVDVHLVSSPRPARYSLHDLLRAYAAERAELDLTAGERETAVKRLVTWYTLTVDSANLQLVPGRVQQAPDPLRGVPPAAMFPTTAEAYAWCQGERANLLSAVYLARAYGAHRLTGQLATALWSFLKLEHDLRSCVSILEVALDQVLREGDPAAEAGARNNLGIALTEDGRMAAGIAQLEICLAIRRDLGDLTRASGTLNNLGIAAMEAGQPERALRYLREGVELVQLSGDPRREAVVRANLGELLLRLGHPRRGDRRDPGSGPALPDPTGDRAATGVRDGNPVRGVSEPGRAGRGPSTGQQRGPAPVGVLRPAWPGSLPLPARPGAAGHG
jgi:DNA-binding SARP family transcriptional activator/tetratricopeptide (TPR) repeat protein